MNKFVLITAVMLLLVGSTAARGKKGVGDSFDAENQCFRQMTTCNSHLPNCIPLPVSTLPYSNMQNQCSHKQGVYQLLAPYCGAEKDFPFRVCGHALMGGEWCDGGPHVDGCCGMTGGETES